MSAADTPMPGEDPGTLPDDEHEGEHDPVTGTDIEANPGLESDSSLPPVEEDPAVKDAEQQPT